VEYRDNTERRKKGKNKKNYIKRGQQSLVNALDQEITAHGRRKAGAPTKTLFLCRLVAEEELVKRKTLGNPANQKEEEGGRDI